MTDQRGIAINVNTLTQVVGLVVIVVTAVWGVSRIEANVRVLTAEVRHLREVVAEVKKTMEKQDERLRALERRGT